MTTLENENIQPPNTNCVSTSQYQISRAQDLPDTASFKRIGVIPYFMQNDAPFFFLMIDATYNEITDSGGFSRKKERWSKTASRETREETRGFFSYSSVDIENRGIVIYKTDMSIAVVFMYEDSMTWDKSVNLCSSYQTSYQDGILAKDRKETLENSDMIVLPIKDLARIAKSKSDVNGYKVYKPVRFLIRYAFRNFLNKFCTDVVMAKPIPLEDHNCKDSSINCRESNIITAA